VNAAQLAFAAVSAVSTVSGVPLDLVTRSTRALGNRETRTKIRRARQLAWWILRECSDLSYPEIGAATRAGSASWDHTTVISGYRRWGKLVSADPGLLAQSERAKGLFLASVNAVPEVDEGKVFEWLNTMERARQELGTGVEIVRELLRDNARLLAENTELRRKLKRRESVTW